MSIDARDVVVFLGPSLPVREARAVLDADYRPPAAQGDVHRAALGAPAAIVLIDGRFGNVPAVWHKEVLAALADRIPVLGAASMGALRAAELHEFGMEGHGAVFERYRDGDLVADDAVAVAHGPAESGYRCISEALVNIEATLRAALLEEVIDSEDADRLAQVARRMFYPERTWPMLLANHPHAGLEAWLPHGRIDQKRRDATGVLRLVATRLSDGLAPAPADLVVEDSQVWARARAHATITGTSDGPPFDLVADALRVMPARPPASAYAAAYRDALLRHTMLTLATHLQLTPPAPVGLTPEERRAREREVLQRTEAQCYDAVLARLAADLSDAPAYEGAMRRARAAAQVLAEWGGAVPSARAAGVNAEVLIEEYVRERAAGLLDAALAETPDDLSRLARTAGFTDADALRRALVLHHVAQDDERPDPIHHEKFIDKEDHA